ncbi:uncharacterized protein LOC110442826 isoform X2 [Mizuhopecten yessoensis]|uniref:RRM domain-containing protein n=1 Tax=Mizuhopecten yessoensis TaxID=6573 RepID=A0A210PGG6_MIZYE|nr:uncharacterized protein LOC110442826 isoform X2 [Mizuhopecten yessoensis]OWF35536.1 hypothetical protein KP79_PYT08041 [Mizuhopecten yessoensis]
MAESFASSVPIAPYNSFSLNSYSSNLVQDRTLPYKSDTDNIWRVFCRLADPKQPVSVIRQHYLDRTGPTFACTIKDPPTSTLAKKPGVRCMCYENVIHFVRQVCCNSAVRLSTTEEKKQLPTSWMRSSTKHFRENERLQFPLASVVVRWQQKRYPIDFNHKLLHTIFSKFGTVREIRKLSPNSALVVFEELNAACDVIYSNYIGMCGSKLHCRWWHKCMESKEAICFGKGVKMQPVPFL